MQAWVKFDTIFDSRLYYIMMVYYSSGRTNHSGLEIEKYIAKPAAELTQDSTTGSSGYDHLLSIIKIIAN